MNFCKVRNTIGQISINISWNIVLKNLHLYDLNIVNIAAYYVAYSVGNWMLNDEKYFLTI